MGDEARDIVLVLYTGPLSALPWFAARLYFCEKAEDGIEPWVGEVRIYAVGPQMVIRLGPWSEVV